MTSGNISRYLPPGQWIYYDLNAVFEPLVEARAQAIALSSLPYFPQWIETVHEEQLRLEAVGTSRIEGAEFSLREQSEALLPGVDALADLTHSQRQLRAADSTYRWLRSQPAGRPVNPAFILEIHRRIVSGCDDQHCEPGALRPDGWNVTFGGPVCRGASGGGDCAAAFAGLCDAVAGEFFRHDPIIQALALHYHIGAMHPFGDGNGRTARAVESFMLQKAGVSSLIMVSLSNYYYTHQDEYRAALYESRRRGHALTPFLLFALPAVAERCKAVAGEILDNNKRILFRQFAVSLFGKLRTPRRRALGERQLAILEFLLDAGDTELLELLRRTEGAYSHLKTGFKAQVRDIGNLLVLGAISLGTGGVVSVNLNWPQQTSETDSLHTLENMPSAMSHNHPFFADLSQLLRRRR